MVTNARDNGYAGAQSHTNNTAELSALLHALEWALESDYPRHEDDPLLLRYDSQYAANIMTVTGVGGRNQAVLCSDHGRTAWFGRKLETGWNPNTSD